MKITFEDKSFLEIVQSNDPDLIIISVGAKDYQNNRKLIVNSIEITKDQFQELYKQFI